MSAGRNREGESGESGNALKLIPLSWVCTVLKKWKRTDFGVNSDMETPWVIFRVVNDG